MNRTLAHFVSHLTLISLWWCTSFQGATQDLVTGVQDMSFTDQLTGKVASTVPHDYTLIMNLISKSICSSRVICYVKSNKWQGIFLYFWPCSWHREVGSNITNFPWQLGDCSWQIICCIESWQPGSPNIIIINVLLNAYIIFNFFFALFNILYLYARLTVWNAYILSLADFSI